MGEHDAGVEMAKKIRRMRTFARTAAKSMEKKLVENAKALKKDPYQVLPSYNDSYSSKYLGKLKKSLQKVHHFSDDVKKLEKLAKKRDLSGALAGTLLLANAEKAPYLAVAKFPTGDIAYAQRGNADKEKLVAVQYFDDPMLRLLGIKDVALKRRLHVYSWDGGFVCTGIEAQPPKEFIDFVIGETSCSCKKGVATCGHISAEKLKTHASGREAYLRIQWHSADAVLAICEDCAKTTGNTLFTITKYLLEPHLKDDFTIQVEGQVIKQDDDHSSTKYIDDYLSGALTDIQLIRKNMEERKTSLAESGEKMFVLDGVSYDTDINGFIDALQPNTYEKTGLAILLQRIHEPLILSDVTPNKLLERFWKDHGVAIIVEMIGNTEMAKKFAALPDTPSEILELAANYKQRQQILSQLPQYPSLPPLATFADHIARTYRAFGMKKTIAELKKRPDNPKGKSLSYAFLLAFDRGKDTKWQYSPVEIEYGEFLRGYAQRLLDVQPKQYHKALQDLLVASGSSETIPQH